MTASAQPTWRIGDWVQSPYGECTGLVLQVEGRFVHVEWDDGDRTWSRADLLKVCDE